MKKLMKMFALVLGIAGMMMMTSCKKDPADLIVGKWQAVSQTTNGTLDDINFEKDLYTMEFTADGNVIVFLNDDKMNATYVVTDNNLTITQTAQGMTFSSDFTINEITKKKMVLQSKFKSAYADDTIVVEFKKI